MEVYRYMNLEKFKDIVEKGALYFVNPFRSWSDKKEGYLYREAKDIERLNKMKNCLKDKFGANAIIEQLQHGGMEKIDNTNDVVDWFGMRCQSWCKEGNSSKMWKEYSSDNCSVCIAVDTAKLLKLHYNRCKVEGMNVVYKNDLEIEEELKETVDGSKFYFPFILRTKSSEFEFEQEYRLYVMLLDENGHNEDKEHKAIHIQINEPVSSFINEVRCNPEAPDYFKKELKEYCKKYNLKLG